MTLERVAKLVAQRGLCSRREAERLMVAGQVLVDGAVVRALGAKAHPEAGITIASAAAAARATLVTVALHKPVGVVSTQPSRGQVAAWRLLTAERFAGDPAAPGVARVLAHPAAWSVAGRLDRASRGLLVLTEDGAVARRLIGGAGVPKTYTVRVAEPVSERQVRALRGRFVLDGVPLRPMQVARPGPHALRFVLLEGRKHQIRRVCGQVGLTVVDLFRTAIGPIRLGDLTEGRWRLVTPDELSALGAAPPPSEARRRF